MKRCTVCGEEKPLDQFNRGSGRDGRGSYCKPCAAEYARTNYHANRDQRRAAKAAARAANPAKYRAANAAWKAKNPEKVRDLDLRRYGIDSAEYDALLDRQGGGCAGCGGGPVGRRKHLDVDHDHSTGKVRGLLCSPCNMLLGKAQDDSLRLRRLADYLDFGLVI